MHKSRNIHWTTGHVTAAQRAQRHGHPGCVVWLTGLSCSGKTTIAAELERHLFERGKLVYVLDGDNIRHGLCADLAFSPADRHENIRRVGEVAKLFADAGLICITAFISPYRADRDAIRRSLPPGQFIEVYLNAPLEVCEQRDPKGLYAKARAGEIPDFTGVSAPYEPPLHPELELPTAQLPVATASPASSPTWSTHANKGGRGSRRALTPSFPGAAMDSTKALTRPSNELASASPMRLGINTFLFTSPFTNESTKLFKTFKKWGFDTVEIPIEDPSHIDPAHVKRELDKHGLVCGSVCACLGPGPRPARHARGSRRPASTT